MFVLDLESLHLPKVQVQFLSQRHRVKFKVTRADTASVGGGSPLSNKSSAIAEMARLALVNASHGMVENPILDASSVVFTVLLHMNFVTIVRFGFISCH